MDASKEGQALQSVGRLGGAAEAKGQVQKAMGQNVVVDGIWDDFVKLAGVQTEFGDFLGSLEAVPYAEKIVAVQTLVPLMKHRLEADPAALTAKKCGVLKGYRAAGEKNGIDWTKQVSSLQGRGMAVWESERQALADPGLQLPGYYVYAGLGPLHSYDGGNCNWEAAFDVKSAFELVHMHHFPDLTPEQCMAEMHKRLDDAMLGAVQCGPVTAVVDVGCGGGTSTFSLRQSLDRHGYGSAKLTGVDLSTHFLAVARYRQSGGDWRGDGPEARWSGAQLDFRHGDGLQLGRLGFGDGSVEAVMLAKVTHEAPTHVNKMLLAECCRVLKPGGVVGYIDINPVQTLKTNPVSNLVQRVAISNEPYYGEYLSMDLAAAVQGAGMEVVFEAATNSEKWPCIDDCPARVMVFRKPR